MSELGLKRIGLVLVLVAAFGLVVWLARRYQPAGYAPSEPLSGLSDASSSPRRSEPELLDLIKANPKAPAGEAKNYNQLLNLLK